MKKIYFLILLLLIFGLSAYFISDVTNNKQQAGSEGEIPSTLSESSDLISEAISSDENEATQIPTEAPAMEADESNLEESATPTEDPVTPSEVAPTEDPVTPSEATPTETPVVSLAAPTQNELSVAQKNSQQEETLLHSETDRDYATATAFYTGRGDHSPDFPKAYEYYLKSAHHGNPRSQFNIAWMYQYGEGIGMNLAQARIWYEKAAMQGHIRAQYRLGVMLKEGVGGDKDLKQARDWFSKASQQGDWNSKAELL